MNKTFLIVFGIALLAAAWFDYGYYYCAFDKTDCKEYDGRWVKKGSWANTNERWKRIANRTNKLNTEHRFAIDPTAPKIRNAKKLREMDGEFRVQVILTEDADPLEWIDYYQLQGATLSGGRHYRTGEIRETRQYNLYINQKILSALEFDDFVMHVRYVPKGTVQLSGPIFKRET